MVYVQEVLDRKIIMKICVVIPSLNESSTIAELVKKIIEFKLDVLVIDDGSQDNTSEIAGDSGAKVIRNEANEGKGASLSKGFRYCLENGYDAVITMDGDGQHSPDDLPVFIRGADSDNSIIVGNRMQKTKNMPFVRLLTNKFMSWLISKVAKQKIPDTQCGFRLIKREVLEKVELSTARYEAESEILIKASKLGFKIGSVPIKSVYKGEVSKINPLTDTIRFIKYIKKEL